MPSPLPRQNGWVRIAHFPNHGSLPRNPDGSASALNFSRLTRRSHVLRPVYSSSHLVALCTEGSSCFVTSTTASITTGRSDSCRVGFAPTGRACLSTARRIGNSNHPSGLSLPTTPVTSRLKCPVRLTGLMLSPSLGAAWFAWQIGPPVGFCAEPRPLPGRQISVPRRPQTAHAAARSRIVEYFGQLRGDKHLFRIDAVGRYSTRHGARRPAEGHEPVLLVDIADYYAARRRH
jgi:hypothetical protein